MLISDQHSSYACNSSLSWKCIGYCRKKCIFCIFWAFSNRFCSRYGICFQAGFNCFWTILWPWFRIWTLFCRTTSSFLTLSVRKLFLNLTELMLEKCKQEKQANELTVNIFTIWPHLASSADDVNMAACIHSDFKSRASKVVSNLNSQASNFDLLWRLQTVAFRQL